MAGEKQAGAARAWRDTEKGEDVGVFSVGRGFRRVLGTEERESTGCEPVCSCREGSLVGVQGAAC